MIYSELHQNIQDWFNDANVEIMSPGYTAYRDGGEVTTPTQHQNHAPGPILMPQRFWSRKYYTDQKIRGEKER